MIDALRNLASSASQLVIKNQLAGFFVFWVILTRYEG